MSNPLVDSLPAYLEQTMPGWPAPAIGGFMELSIGWESELFAFSLESGPPDRRDRQDVVLRLYQGPDGAAKSANEFRGMRLLWAAGYPVPGVLLAESDAGVLGKPFMIMERIPGEPGWELVYGPDPAFLIRFVDLLACLHDLDPRPFAELAPGGIPADLIAAQLGLWHGCLDRLELDAFRPAMEWLEEHAGNVAPTAPSVIHFDFHPDNLLVGPDGYLTVIDWTQIGVSDPRFDLAWTLLLAGTYKGAVWRDRILAGYETRRGSVPDIRYFEVAAATKRLVSVVGSLLVGPEMFGMRAEAREMMVEQMEPTRLVYAVFTDHTGLRIPEVEALLQS